MFETTRPVQKSLKSRCSSADHAEVRPGSAAAASSSPSVSSSGASSSRVTYCESAWESNPPRNVLRPVNGFEDRGHHRVTCTLMRIPEKTRAIDGTCRFARARLGCGGSVTVLYGGDVRLIARGIGKRPP